MQAVEIVKVKDDLRRKERGSCELYPASFYEIVKLLSLEPNTAVDPHGRKPPGRRPLINGLRVNMEKPADFFDGQQGFSHSFTV